MALVRILVDGYSLIHSWPELAPGKPRHSAAAREELIRWLTQYRDACGTPVTIVFDGSDSGRGRKEKTSTPDVEILYSRAGQTADDIIERAAHRLAAYGEVLVVTDDLAERETASSLGAVTSSCSSFVQTLHHALDELQRDLGRHNRKERTKYREP